MRKLHADELVHLREVVAEQQATIEAQAAEIEELRRQISWAEHRADTFGDMVNELRDRMPEVRVGLTRDGAMGVLA